MRTAPVILFVPVSSTEGIGEYMRSTIIADEISQRWPDAHIEFVLNRAATYADQCQYPHHLVNDTPTKCVKEVNELVSQLKPDMVIFDAAGRKAQLKHAHKCGAKVVFISQHKRKRARGMKIERALVTDSHWVVQPQFIIGDISAFSKYKLNFIKRPLPIITGSIFAKPDQSRLDNLLQQYGLTAGEYLIYSAGSGGHKKGEQFAADIFAETAAKVYAQTGIPSLMIFGANYPKQIANYTGVVTISSLDSRDFISLLSQAKGAILSGGDTLLQSIALNIPTVAVPVSKDQPSRIKPCESQKLVLSSKAKVVNMVAAAQSLVDDKTRRMLISNMQSIGGSGGLDLAMNEVTHLLDEKY